ncbi:MAG TPA: PilZ domain-containing protein [Archangium sp.]|uniref:PilZ domain-containing protein n=1 Tax=Archangium sp. TaxID=1872627 RepID=UPI002EDAB2FD
MAEKRQHRRIKRRLMVRFGERDLTQSGFTGDVSVTGLFVIAASIPKLDTRLHVQLFVEAERYLLFEGEVRRHKLVPPELRTLERSGFGVRLLTPREVLNEALNQELQVQRFELVYPLQASFQQAYEREMRMGAVFISTSKQLPRDTEVVLSLVLEFAGRVVELETLVAQAFSPQTGHGTVVGLALMFKDRARADALLRPFLG